MIQSLLNHGNACGNPERHKYKILLCIAIWNKEWTIDQLAKEVYQIMCSICAMWLAIFDS